MPSDPVLLDTGVQISCVAWNENGSILAVGGQQKFLSDGQPEPGVDQSVGVVQFYNPFGDVRYRTNACLENMKKIRYFHYDS